MAELNIGDKVKVVNDFYIWLESHNLPKDTILTIVEDDDTYNSYVNSQDKTIETGALRTWPNDFEKVEDVFFAGCNAPQNNQVSGNFKLNEPTEVIQELGVYRPKLEDRKVGKVGMHMVIDGFPRALREVAKVMTWAAEVKGYKLHDWRNLPDADIAFPAAEYRHQSDNCIMKAEGTPAIERTDHESNLLHAAHKVFNSLAELELVLEGKIV